MTENTFDISSPQEFHDFKIKTENVEFGEINNMIELNDDVAIRNLEFYIKEKRQ